MVDITISNPTTWSSVNELASISSGTHVLITNKSSSIVIMQSVDNQPDNSNSDGIPLTTIFYPYATWEVEDNSDEIWVRPVIYGQTIIINVEEL